MLTQMAQRLINKKIGVLKCIQLDVLASSQAEGKKTRRQCFGGKKKIFATVAIAALLLISFFATMFYQNQPLNRWFGIDFMPQKQSGGAGLVPGQPANSSFWLNVATNAWAYFQPGIGVNPDTGLPYASGTNFEAFTAWDLGAYIQAIIDAQELGLVSVGGAWGSSARIAKVMDFLENRPLNQTTGYPFWYYDATNGQDYHSLSDEATWAVDEPDMGRLFVALNNLRNFNSSLTSSIDYLVYNQSDYAALLPGIENGAATSNSVYAYYIYSGFACFWPQQVGDAPSQVMTNIANTPNITTYGVSLPDAEITCEPLLCSIFELNNSNVQLSGLMKEVYLAHEAYYNATGQYVAFSEGNSFGSQYLYEWVVAPNGGAWKITDTSGAYVNVNPIIYTKVAFSFLALYNSTFAQNLVVYLEKMLPNPADGYSDGADNSGQCVPGAGCDTNGLILDAALYAIQK